MERELGRGGGQGDSCGIKFADSGKVKQKFKLRGKPDYFTGSFQNKRVLLKSIRGSLSHVQNQIRLHWKLEHEFIANLVAVDCNQ